jgi:hypothetical protein
MTVAHPQPGGRGRLADVATDIAGVLGAVLITYGVSLIYQPAAFITGGGFLLAGAWLQARRAGD